MTFRSLPSVIFLLVACGGDTVQEPVDDTQPNDTPTDIAGSWTNAASLPEGISEMTGVVTQGHIYIAGGFDVTQTTTAAAYRFDIAAGRWDRIADLPAPRHHMPLAVLNDSVYAVGGLTGAPILGTGGFAAANTLWVYDPTGDQWVGRTPLPEPRGASAVGVVDGELIVVGGYDDNVQLLDSIAVYDPTINTWRHGPPIPSPRDHLAAAVVDGLVYAIGGRRVGINATTGAVEVYDPGAGTWATAASLPTPRGGLGAARLGNRIFVLGGEPAIEMLRAHEVYDTAQDRWFTAPRIPNGRHGVAVVAVDGRIYVIGGGPEPGFSQTTEVNVFTPSP